MARKFCEVLGYRITPDPAEAVVAAVAWQDVPLRPPAYPPLEALRGTCRVINIDCRDIRKSTVARAFERAFGRRALIDPLMHRGPCVRKLDDNARHDGVIVECPLDAADPKNGYRLGVLREQVGRPGFVYTVLVDNEVEGGLVQDIRVPVMGGDLPFVYLKYRRLEERFANKNERVEVAEARDVLSALERGQLLALCGELGLDYGELDVLRDRRTGELWVVDVNNTPVGPPGGLPEPDATRALERLASAFEAAFLRAPVA